MAGALGRGVWAVGLVVIAGLAGLWLAACAALVGVGDVPPASDGSPSPAEEGSVDAALEAAALDRAEPTADADAGMPAPPVDATPETSVDAGVPDAMPDVVIPAECSSNWDTYDPGGCGLCGQENCCSALAACEAVDDAGLDSNGRSFCNGFVHCVTGYQNSPGSNGEALCMGTYSSSELALGKAVLACVGTSCPMLCQNL
jgi:hypothetical protein